MTSRICLLLLGMAAVTYLPRALPAIFVGKVRFGARMERFLNLLPYTAMASLIFPGILTVDPARPYIGLLGGLAAGVLAYKKLPVMVCVVAAILVDLLLYALIA